MYVEKRQKQNRGLSFTPTRLEGKERSRINRKTSGIYVVEVVVCTEGKNTVQCKNH